MRINDEAVVRFLYMQLLNFLEQLLKICSLPVIIPWRQEEPVDDFTEKYITISFC